MTIDASLRLCHVLPAPGPLWGPYPLRAPTDLAPHRRVPALLSPGAQYRRIAAQAQGAVARWLGSSSEDGVDTFFTAEAQRTQRNAEDIQPKALLADLFATRVQRAQSNAENIEASFPQASCSLRPLRPLRLCGEKYFTGLRRTTEVGSPATTLPALRARLRREGLRPAVIAEALAAASAAAQIELGLTPRHSQLMAAAALVDNRMAEMATGEGKTLAIGLAAAVAALAGIPVHVVTANSYLAQRDAQRLAPFYARLGIDVAAITGRDDDDARRATYRHAVVYATAKDLAFDFLRDRQASASADPLEQVAASLGGRAAAPPLMRGLCMALLDEADSILLDEAEVPLILSHSVAHSARRAFMWQALALARQLEAGRDFAVLQADRSAMLTPAGEARLALLAQPLGGPWLRPRYRREALLVALAGLHAHHRNLHYVVRNDAIELLDEVTGRVAEGRVWSRGLHTVVALKEGLKPPAETETVAQTTFQRFFQRYWRLCGISGTLREARGELRQVYAADVLPIPLHRRCRRVECAPHRFADAGAMFAAAARRAGELSAAGRPVLIGTDSVADSELLSIELDRIDVAHRVLNALHDADEAAIVAEAGRAGQITVATRMAGRGTDIELDEEARAAGGLHVLNCQHNPSRRLDRQLAGRAARHGDPGSVESWRCASTARDAAAAQTAGTSRGTGPSIVPLPARLALLPTRWAQWREEQRRSLQRRSLLEQDLHWEKRLAFAGQAV